MAISDNLKFAQYSVLHFFYIATALCAAVALWVVFKHSVVLGMGTLSTFVALLLFAGQMASSRMVEAGKFNTWSRWDQVVFVVSLASVVLTSFAYIFALPEMFLCSK